MNNKRLSATKFIDILKDEYPHIIEWVKKLKSKYSFLGYKKEKAYAILVIKDLILNCENIPHDDMFHLMGVKRSKYRLLYGKAYRWIQDNEDLIIMRLL